MTFGNENASPAGKEDAKSAEQKNKLTDEKIEEFKKHLENLDKKIEEIYGAPRYNERLNVERVKKTLAEIGRCKVDGALNIMEARSRRPVHINKIVFNNEQTGEDALASLNVEINGRLKVPWLKRVNIFDFPFQVKIREKNGKKCIEMSHTFPHPKYIAEIRLFIREKLI